MTTAAIAATPSPVVSHAAVKTGETTIMTVWPSVAMYGLGRFLGGLYSIRFPDVYIFRLGHLIALKAIPISLVLYFMRVAPFIGKRYTLTNRRVVVQRGIQAVDDKSVELDRFDSITVDVLPGQEWYDAGDLVFKQGTVETFRLAGVSRPETFRQTILKARMAHAGVKQARERQK